MEFLTALRAANAARQAEWDKDGGIDLTYRVVELGGEAGEALNVIKKLERERRGIRGSRATVQDLADEVADVVICVDLIALAEGVTLDPARITGAFKGLTLVEAGRELMANVGWVAEASRGGLLATLEMVLESAVSLARAERIDLGAAVVAKFNATSEKVGLVTRMAAP